MLKHIIRINDGIVNNYKILVIRVYKCKVRLYLLIGLYENQFKLLKKIN